MRLYKNFVLPASLLSGTIIGAGIFALPYVFNLSGLMAGLFYLIFFSLVFTLLHLMYADIIVRTPENHRFPGYVRFYFGETGFYLAFLTSIIGLIFSLTIYLVLSVSFINLSVPQLADFYKLLIFWFLGSLAVFWKVEKVAASEFLVSLGMALIVSIIFIFGLENFKKVLDLPLVNLNYLFLPYGIILFSMAGQIAVPTVLGYFRAQNESPIKAKVPIILGSVFPAVVYLLFVLGIIILSEIVSPDSVSGLVGLSPIALKTLGALGFISLWSTYIMIGRNIKKSLEHDLGASKTLAGLIVVFSPLLLYLFGFQNFLTLVEFTGGLFIGFEAILIILMWQKASKTAEEPGQKTILNKIHPIVIYFLLVVFGAGIIYTLLY